jgi:hypothetical protein
MLDRRPDTVVLTIVTRNHLHYARAFAQSLLAVSPGVDILACVVDATPADDASGEPFRVVRGDQLDIAKWPRFRFQYPADEVCYAIKPFFLEWAMAHTGAGTLMYFDADILVYDAIDDLRAAVDAHEIVLTPQLAEPAASRQSELIARQYGVYNAGFVGVRNSAVGRRFVRWWQGWTHRHGVIDFAGSLACDQAWLDLVPGLFPDVQVERSARYNVARWNLCERELTRGADGRWRVGSDRLVFFHFSGFHVDKSRDGSAVFWPGFDIDRFPLVKELCRDLADRLDACGGADVSRLPYGFACLSDGTPIDPLWREAVRLNHPALLDVSDPQNIAVTRDLRERFERAQMDARVGRLDWRAQAHEEEVVALRRMVEALREDLERLGHRD